MPERLTAAQRRVLVRLDCGATLTQDEYGRYAVYSRNDPPFRVRPATVRVLIGLGYIAKGTISFAITSRGTAALDANGGADG